MEQREHSYLVTIPRKSGGSYSVMVDGSSDRFDEEDTEEYALREITGEISDCKASAMLTKVLVGSGAVKAEQVMVDPDGDEADDYPDDLDYDAAICRRLTPEEAAKTYSDSQWGNGQSVHKKRRHLAGAAFLVRSKINGDCYPLILPVYKQFLD
jgi:hypothetical protein